eukprot:4472596-Pleurochrysis_carterae.AAC.3
MAIPIRFFINAIAVPATLNPAPSIEPPFSFNATCRTGWFRGKVATGSLAGRCRSFGRSSVEAVPTFRPALKLGNTLAVQAAIDDEIAFAWLRSNTSKANRYRARGKTRGADAFTAWCVPIGQLARSRSAMTSVASSGLA